jgi:phosphodiesterase/alkaline phosphatase D-like protein
VTRLALDPLHGGGMPPQPVEVEWRIAADDKMSRIVKSGTSVAAREWGHTVHVEIEGLTPHAWYWYQFRAGNQLSPVGRTRTFPAPRTDADRMRFAFVSCQHYEQGLYTPPSITWRTKTSISRCTLETTFTKTRAGWPRPPARRWRVDDAGGLP